MNWEKYFFKIVALSIGIILLMILDFDKVSNIQDFLLGFAMGVIILCILALVYSLIRSLQENETNKNKE